MATISIEEFSEMARDVNGHVIPVGGQPSVTRQVLTFTTTTESSAFNAATKFIRVVPSADCYVRFGAATQTAITATDMLLKSGVIEYFGVVPGQVMAAVT